MYLPHLTNQTPQEGDTRYSSHQLSSPHMDYSDSSETYADIQACPGAPEVLRDCAGAGQIIMKHGKLNYSYIYSPSSQYEAEDSSVSQYTASSSSLSGSENFSSKPSKSRKSQKSRKSSKSRKSQQSRTQRSPSPSPSYSSSSSYCDDWKYFSDGYSEYSQDIHCYPPRKSISKTSSNSVTCASKRRGSIPAFTIPDTKNQDKLSEKLREQKKIEKKIDKVMKKEMMMIKNQKKKEKRDIGFWKNLVGGCFGGEGRDYVTSGGSGSGYCAAARKCESMSKDEEEEEGSKGREEKIRNRKSKSKAKMGILGNAMDPGEKGAYMAISRSSVMG